MKEEGLFGSLDSSPANLAKAGGEASIGGRLGESVWEALSMSAEKGNPGAGTISGARAGG